jgi:hypothetical protein
MPTKSTLNETPRSVASDDPSAGQNPDLTTASQQLDSDQSISSADRISSATERLAGERTERRRQRAATNEAPRRMTFRDSVSITLIALLCAGGVLGAILGALNVTGWVIGLLVAGLTVVVSAILRRYSRLT